MASVWKCFLPTFHKITLSLSNVRMWICYIGWSRMRAYLIWWVVFTFSFNFFDLIVQKWCHNTFLSDTQHNKIQHNDAQHNDIQPDNNKNVTLSIMIQSKMAFSWVAFMLRITFRPLMLSFIMLSVVAPPKDVLFPHSSKNKYQMDLQLWMERLWASIHQLAC